MEIQLNSEWVPNLAMVMAWALIAYEALEESLGCSFGSYDSLQANRIMGPVLSGPLHSRNSLCIGDAPSILGQGLTAAMWDIKVPRPHQIYEWSPEFYAVHDPLPRATLFMAIRGA